MSIDAPPKQCMGGKIEQQFSDLSANVSCSCGFKGFLDDGNVFYVKCPKCNCIYKMKVSVLFKATVQPVVDGSDTKISVLESYEESL